MNDKKYPNISFKESIVGPTPTNRPWRDTIGVVGEFDKGPADLVYVNNRPDFARIYAETDAPGSVEVQQAMLLGASRFKIARAVPVSSKSAMTFSFQSGNANIDPLIGYVSSSGNPSLVPNSNRTLGIKLDLNYVGSPQVNRITFDEITTESRYLSHATFTGRGSLKLFVTDFVYGNASGTKLSGTNALSIQTNVTSSTNPIQLAKLTFPTTPDQTALLPFLTPGNRVTGTGYNLLVLAEPLIDYFGSGVHGLLTQTLPAVTTSYVSAAGATSSGKVVTVTTTTGLVVGAGVSVTAGVGAFVAGTIVTAIISGTTFEVSVAPTTALSGGASVVTGAGAGGSTAAAGPTAGTVNQATGSNYIIGYKIDAIDAGSVDPYTASTEYFKLLNASYDDGYNVYDIDSYYALPASSTAVQAFTYQVATSADVITQEHFGAFGSNLGIAIKYTKTGSTRVALQKGGQVSIPFAIASVLVGDSTDTVNAYALGTPFTEVIRDLENAIFADATFATLISDVESSTLLTPYVVTLRSALLGFEANRLDAKIIAYTSAGTEADDIKVLLPDAGSISNIPVVSTNIAFKGAYDGSRYAYKDFYTVNGIPLVRIEFASPGIEGNNTKVSIVPVSNSATDATFNVIVNYKDRKVNVTETLTLSNKSIDFTTGVYLGSTGSSYIRAYFLPVAEPATDSSSVENTVYGYLPLRQAPPLGRYDDVLDTGFTAIAAQGASYTASVSLTDGYSYDKTTRTESSVKNASYLAAVKRLASADITVLMICGIAYGSGYDEVFDEAIKQVETSSPENGIRTAVFEAPIGASARQIASLAARLNSDRITLLPGRNRSVNITSNTTPTISGNSGLYAAALVTRPPFYSPASTYGNFLLRNVISVDTPNDPDYFEAITEAHSELLIYDAGIGSHKFLNGITTSSDPLLRYVSVRRLIDQILSDLSNFLQYARSEPNNDDLLRRISNSCDAYLLQRLRDGYLTAVGPTICNKQNNSQADRENGRVNIRLDITPVYPADFIEVDVQRRITQDFSVPTG